MFEKITAAQEAEMRAIAQTDKGQPAGEIITKHDACRAVPHVSPDRAYRPGRSVVVVEVAVVVVDGTVVVVVVEVVVVVVVVVVVGVAGGGGVVVVELAGGTVV